jgi:hypothetical protein
MMDESSADPIVDRLSSDLTEAEFADCVSSLTAVPEPAILRLVEALNGSAAISAGNHPIETYNRRIVALAFLCSQHPDVALDLIERRGLRMTLGVIQGLGSSDDPRLRALATEALKSGGF